MGNSALQKRRGIRKGPSYMRRYVAWFWNATVGAARRLSIRKSSRSTRTRDFAPLNVLRVNQLPFCGIRFVQTHQVDIFP